MIKELFKRYCTQRLVYAPFIGAGFARLKIT
jgi:hypothetical protein